MEYMTIILTSSVIGVVISSLFSLIQFLITRHDNKKAQVNLSCIEMQKKHEKNFEKIEGRLEEVSDLCMGLAYDRIIHVGESFLNRGWITVDEREDFRKYLWGPYHQAGGNGSGDAMMKAIDELPIKKKGEKS
jgi:hypothetical protein